MIVSFIEGRVRLRHQALTDESTLESMTSATREYPGIRKVTANVRTGSLLIEYDAEMIPAEMLLSASQALEAQFFPAQEQPEAPQGDVLKMDAQEVQVVQRLEEMLVQMKGALKNDSGLLLALLMGSAGSGFLGFKRWHTLLGSSLVAASMRHFGKRNKQVKKYFPFK